MTNQDSFPSYVNMIDVKEETESKVAEDRWIKSIVDYMKDSKLP